MRVPIVMNTLYDLLTVAGVLAGIGALLVLMSALDPTNDARHASAHRDTRERRPLAPPVVGEQSSRRD